MTRTLTKIENDAQSRDLKQADSWHPIATAPKNAAGEFHGPWIVVWNERDGSVHQVRWQHDASGRGYWQGIGADVFKHHLKVSQLTHWQWPLRGPEAGA